MGILDTLVDRMRKLCNHGASPKYHHALVGRSFRLEAILS